MRVERDRRYLPELLAPIGRRRRALDIGCGSGELTRLLALRCASVTGVDASPAMVAEARRRNWGLNVEYQLGDAAAYLEGREAAFDCIVSVAALHLMDEWRMLSLCKAALAPGGVLVVLDLYKAETLGDFALSAAAAALTPLSRLARLGRAAAGPEEREARARLAEADRYRTMGELRALAIGALGECRLERKLFGRYLLSYEKPRDGCGPLDTGRPRRGRPLPPRRGRGS